MNRPKPNKRTAITRGRGEAGRRTKITERPSRKKLVLFFRKTGRYGCLVKGSIMCPCPRTHDLHCCGAEVLMLISTTTIKQRASWSLFLYTVSVLLSTIYWIAPPPAYALSTPTRHWTAINPIEIYCCSIPHARSLTEETAEAEVVKNQTRTDHVRHLHGAPLPHAIPLVNLLRQLARSRPGPAIYCSRVAADDHHVSCTACRFSSSSSSCPAST